MPLEKEQVDPRIYATTGVIGSQVEAYYDMSSMKKESQLGSRNKQMQSNKDISKFECNEVNIADHTEPESDYHKKRKYKQVYELSKSKQTTNRGVQITSQSSHRYSDKDAYTKAYQDHRLKLKPSNVPPL